MDYKRIHDLIIEKGKNRIKEENEYYERHHILPKCLGGRWNKENIVYLTAKEHFIVHYLLINIYPESKSLKYALWCMCNGQNKYRDYKISSRIYERTKIQFSELHKLIEPPFKGKKHTEISKEKIRLSKIGKKFSEETKRKIGETKKGNTYRLGISQSPETRDKISKSSLGKKKSKTHRENISKAQSGVNNNMFGKTGKLNKLSKPCFQIDKNGLLIKEWDNALIASKELGLSYTGINNCLNKNKTQTKATSCGFIWKYK